MDAAEAQDLVDAWPLKYPESGSDGEEEEEELESLGLRILVRTCPHAG